MEHTNGNDEFETDDFDMDDEEDEVCEDDIDTEPPPPPSPKDQFTHLVQQILSLAAGSPQVYQKLHDTVAPFDRELAAKLGACKRADEDLIAYCQKKVEQAKG